MKKLALATLLLWPTVLAAGWEYYVLNNEGEWEQVSRFELDLTAPKVRQSSGTGEDRRVMIIYNRFTEKEEPEGRNWLPGIGQGLVEATQ